MLYLTFDNPYEFKAYAGDTWLPLAAHAAQANSAVEAWRQRIDVWRPRAGRPRITAVDLHICNARAFASHAHARLGRPGFRRPVLTVFESETWTPPERAGAGQAGLAAVLTLPATIHRRLAAVLGANPDKPELGFAVGLDVAPMVAPGARILPADTEIADRWLERRRAPALEVCLLEVPHVDHRAHPPARFDAPKLLHTETMRPAWRDKLGIG